MSRAGALLFVLMTALAFPALAQDAPADQSTDMDDPIGDLLTGPVPLQRDAPPPPVQPTLNRPVTVDETGLTPDRPLAPVELGYDYRVRSSIASAQGQQGPLDGSWTVAAQDGEGIYRFQLVDPGGVSSALEGAWRDLRRQGTGTTGFLAGLERAETTLTIRLYPATGSLVMLTLTPDPTGGWTGEINENGLVRPVSMRRN